jgi:hypothetical protein
MAIEIISGPEILLRSDERQACRFCSLALPEALDYLIAHYALHEYSVTADYVYEGVRFVELDKNGRCSERAKRTMRRGLLSSHAPNP